MADSMTVDEFKRLASEMGKTHREIAESLGVNPVTVAKWAAGMRGITPERAADIRALASRVKAEASPAAAIVLQHNINAGSSSLTISRPGGVEQQIVVPIGTTVTIGDVVIDTSRIATPQQKPRRRK